MNKIERVEMPKLAAETEPAKPKVKTKIIEIYGGPGCGKSTVAAGLYYQLKLAENNAELVREYVKKWAWEGVLPNSLDQLYITGKQSKAEHMLYGKVSHIVTDCPLWMGVIYDWKYNDSLLVLDAVRKFHEMTNESVERHRFLLTRSKAFNPEGRFCSAEGASDTDKLIRDFLDSNGLDYTVIKCRPETQVNQIYKSILHKEALETKVIDIEAESNNDPW